MEGLKSLGGKWEQLRLTEEEDDFFFLDDEANEADRTKERRSLIGKICIERTIGKEVIRKTVGRIWRISKPATFTEVEKYIFCNFCYGD